MRTAWLLTAALAAPLLANGQTGAIHSVAYSHGDLGYADYPHVLRTENRLENLFRAIQYCEDTAGWDAASRYRWQQEMAEPIPLFLAHCTPAQREQLVRHVRDGRISIAVSHCTVLGERLNPESASRLFYLGGRHVPDLLNVPPGRTLIINDVTGLPWSLPIYCESAGVAFLVNGHNSCGRMEELESAPLVRWVGAGATGSVLALSCVYNHHAVSKPAAQVPGAAARDGRHITDHFLPVWLQGHDFAITSLEMATSARAWNATGNPKVQMSTFDLYLEELASRQPADKTPSISKTGPCQWMDQPITDAWQFGRARMAGEALPAAEKFASIATAATGTGYPWLDLTMGWHNLLSNFEHTIGAACWRVKNAEGWRHYETENVEHRQEALVAAEAARQALDVALARLAGRISTPHPRSFAVFNPLARARTDVVSVPKPAGKAFVAVDDETGRETPCQALEVGRITFVARDVPALGYRTFHLVEKETPAAENPFYEIRMDPATGCIASLFDKELGRELVRAGGPHAFNQYLYEWYDTERDHPSKWSSPPADASITTERGPVATVVRVRAKAGGANSLEQTLTLYHALKRMDFELRLDKKPCGRSLADYHANNLLGKESVFVGLPLDIPEFKAVYQTGGGGVAEPVCDQFRGTGTAFHAVQHFADVSNGQFGVTVSPVDCALVQFGHPRSDAMSRVVKGGEARYEKKMEAPTSSSLYIYLMNNMFTTNIRIDQRGEHRFRWALRSHSGDWREGRADQFGEAVNQPLVAREIATREGSWPAGARSFAAVDAGNVTLSTIKLAEWNGDGYIVRLVETSGQKTSCTLQLPFLAPIASVHETTLTETDLDKPVNFSGDSVRLELPSYGVKTLRVRRVGTAVAQVEGVAPKPVSDLEIALEWSPVPGAAFYRVYRDVAADFTPSPLTLVAMPAEPRLLDRARNNSPGWMDNRLSPGTQYHYRVEAVSAGNRRGPASPVASAKTMATQEKACPPSAVQDVEAVLVSPVAPVNQVNLLWRSNPEPNIAGYEIHRSTNPGFSPSPSTLLARQEVVHSKKATVFRAFTHQMFLDTTVDYNTLYHYRVRALTHAGLAGDCSQGASVRTKAKELMITAQSVSEYGAAEWAVDGNPSHERAWISARFGGGTKESPRDVWWAIELPREMPPVAGVKILGDSREAIPPQRVARLQVREGEEWKTVAEAMDIHGKDFVLRLSAPAAVTAFRVFFPAAHLPQAGSPAHLERAEGYVRICEFKILLPDGREINPATLSGAPLPAPASQGPELLGNDAKGDQP